MALEQKERILGTHFVTKSKLDTLMTIGLENLYIC